MKYNKSLLFILLAVLLASCSLQRIKYSRNGASIPVGAKTFSVNYIDNRAPYVDPNLSNDLTEALKEKFRSETNLSEVVDGDGDLHFEGEITSDRLQALDITRDEYAARTRLTISVKIRYTNKITDKWDYESEFSAYQDLGETEDRTEAEEKVKLIVKQLVEDIYNKAVVNW